MCSAASAPPRLGGVGDNPAMPMRADAQPRGHVTAIDHVQLAMPAGGEDDARRFYSDVLGLVEVPKPAGVAGRGGCWFVGLDVGVAVHVGVEDDFRPATRGASSLRRG